MRPFWPLLAMVSWTAAVTFVATSSKSPMWSSTSSVWSRRSLALRFVSAPGGGAPGLCSISTP